METNESLNIKLVTVIHTSCIFSLPASRFCITGIAVCIWLEKQDFKGCIWACFAYGHVLTHSLPCEEIVRTKEL